MESCLTFACGDDELIGILHRGLGSEQRVGVVIVVGGPQYRVGSHRQFVLMARSLAAAGYPVLRFDYRGMGDSAGAARRFEAVDDDIRAAVDALLRELPQLRGVFLFGLCDAASAALMSCGRDARLLGLILANPWVRTEAGQAKALVRHYYGERLLQPAFWRKVVTGELGVWRSAREFLRSWLVARRTGTPVAIERGRDFIPRMRDGLVGFGGPVLCLISEQDLTATEFADLCRDSPDWAKAMARPNVSLVRLDGADHTFSSAADLERATGAILGWLSVRFQPSTGDRREA